MLEGLYDGILWSDFAPTLLRGRDHCRRRRGAARQYLVRGPGWARTRLLRDHGIVAADRRYPVAGRDRDGVSALAAGIPGGVVAGFVPAIDRLLEPIFDLVQTPPPYIYLLPAIGLLGYGPATALVATIIVALLPALRLYVFGIPG